MKSAEKLKPLRKVGMDLDGISTLVFLDANITSFGGCKLLREQISERELTE